MPNRERILVVEDDADTRSAMFTILNTAGYSVLTADNGQQAIDLLDRGIRPRVILIDLLLPKVSGHDLITYLRTDAALKLIPTVVVTGIPKNELRGVIADAVFEKPVDFVALLETIRACVQAPEIGARQAE
jgi:CheY-like chemotaxis protein